MIEIIKSLYKTLSKNNKKIADAFIEHSEEVINLSIYELADYLSVSPASITRFCQKVFSMSFMEVKIAFAKEGKTKQINERISWTSDLNALPGMLSNELDKSINQLILLNKNNKIKKCIKELARAEHIYVYGVGNSGVIAQDFAEKMIKLRKKCIFFSDSSLKVSTAFLPTKGDVVVGISNSGRTKETLLSATQAKTNGAKIISITSNCTNPLRKLADIEIITPDVETDNRIGAIFSRYCGLFVVDLLFIGLSEEILNNPQGIIDSYNKIIDEVNK